MTHPNIENHPSYAPEKATDITVAIPVFKEGMEKLVSSLDPASHTKDADFRSMHTVAPKQAGSNGHRKLDTNETENLYDIYSDFQLQFRIDPSHNGDKEAIGEQLKDEEYAMIRRGAVVAKVVGNRDFIEALFREIGLV